MIESRKPASGDKKANPLKAHQQDVLTHPACAARHLLGNDRTVLVRKGSLRRAKTRRALALCARFCQDGSATGGSGGMS